MGAPMLDPLFFDDWYDVQPKFNPLIAEGFATSQVPSAPEYISNVWKQYEKDTFPEGLRYGGNYEICSPEKAYQVLSQLKTKTKFYYDISHSDIYLVAYHFTLHGEPLKRPVYIMMPYCNRGGWLIIKDSFFHIAPVLGDIAISVEDDGLFIRLKMKLRFKRLSHQIRVNDMSTSLNVVWSQIHNSQERKVKPPLMLYLIAKNGLEGAFRTLANTEIAVGGSHEINALNYPPDAWMICSTARTQWVKRYGKQAIQMRTDVHIAIPKDRWNELTKGMVASFFYLADAFPMQILLQNDLNDQSVWKMVMGSIYFSEGEGISKVIAAIDTHLESVDCYLSSNVRSSLAHDGIHVDDIYELLAEIISSYSRRFAAPSDMISTMYDKRFYVLRYLLEDIVHGITRVTFAMQKHNKPVTTEQDIAKMFADNVKMAQITHLSSPNHAEISSISSPTASLIYKFAMPNVLQVNTSTKATDGSQEVTFGEESVLHASLAEVCCPNSHPDKDPTSRQRTNFYALVDEQGYINRNPKFIELIDRVQERIKR